MEEERIQGYVVGEDFDEWKVRVTQRGHPEEGEKFIVASVRNGLELATGLEVTFLIGFFGSRRKKKAVDVMIASA